MTLWIVVERRPMADFLIAAAKLQFAQLVRRAEAGQPVHITRRGRVAAVLVSAAECTRLSAPRQGLLAYTQALRDEAAAAGITLFSDEEQSGLRDQSCLPAPDLA